MEPMYLAIQQKETGKQIKKLLMENGYTVKDVQMLWDLRIRRQSTNGFPVDHCRA